MKTCVERGVSVIIGAPFASGILVTGSGAGATYAYGKASPEVQARVRASRRCAAAMASARCLGGALQFVLAHPAVASVIPGAARPSEVRERRRAERRDSGRLLVRPQGSGPDRPRRAGAG
jgi:D-threo-aldose 1-dehydrogenase